MHRNIIAIVGALSNNMKLFDIINEGVYDPGIFKAIFLAGGPGSGKSFVGSDLVGIPKGGFSGMDMSFAPSGVKLVNSDPEFEYFLKKIGIDPKDLANLTDEEFKKATEGESSPRAKAKKIKDARERLYTQGRLGLLIDGTGDDYGKIKKKNVELKKLGYDTYMLFINTTLEVAQQRNAQRDRKLPEKLVKSIWTDVQKNLGRFQGLFGSNFKIIDNSEKKVAKGGSKLFPKEFYTALNKFMKSPVKSGLAKRWIKRQLELKKKTGM
jgi:predicted kinase